jgi:hypothetical protein
MLRASLRTVVTTLMNNGAAKVTCGYDGFGLAPWEATFIIDPPTFPRPFPCLAS